MSTVELAQRFLDWYEPFVARYPAFGRPAEKSELVTMWAQGFGRPELLAVLRRMRPELVADIGTSADVTRSGRVADIAHVLSWSADVARWPHAWRLLLRQDRPRLARRLARIEAALERHVAAHAIGEGNQAGWEHALDEYDEVLLAVAVWLDKRPQSPRWS
jgi:hypothetical protein